MKKGMLILTLAALAIAVTLVLVLPKPQIQHETDISREDPPNVIKKKVLFVNSYHEELGWSKGIINGVLDIFENKTDQPFATEWMVDLKIVHMDTKRNKSEEFIKRAAVSAKKIIEEWEPDIVIAADDNASKYLIVPYFKDNKLPFVFCGVNWDASIYGFPFSNVTGMIEVTLVEPAIRTMSAYAAGNKVSILVANTLTGKKEALYISEIIGGASNIEYLNSFYEWKQKYMEMQHNSDMLIMVGLNGINDWNREEAKLLIINETKIPSVMFYSEWAEYTLFTFATSPEEQGKWAAKTALEILNGKSPEEIPIIQNKQARIYLNMMLAKKLGITFPMELIEQATFVSEE
jgi:ABC-type uncharacterized transport system substrate-binding protein